MEMLNDNYAGQTSKDSLPVGDSKAGTATANGVASTSGADAGTAGMDDTSDTSADTPMEFDSWAGNHERFTNRELSWLEFSSRLLDLAADVSLPVMERGKFLAIFSEGLDEFFQVRVAGLKDQVDAGLRARLPDGMRPQEVLAAIRSRVIELVERQSDIFLSGIVPELVTAGIAFSNWSDLAAVEQEYLVEVFERNIYPVLTPLAVDPGHPFPYISNLSLNLIVKIEDPASGLQRVARVKVPPSLPRFIATLGSKRFVPLEQIITAQLERLFPHMNIGETCAFRVTRNADLIVAEDEADDLLVAVEMELRRRRFGSAIRLEIMSGMSPDLVDLLLAELDLTASDVYNTTAPLELAGLWLLYGIDRPDLHEDAWTPMTSYPLADASNQSTDLFSVLAKRDILVHHPYDSFTTSVEAFLSQAAADRDVLAIKQTLYRTSGDSPIISSLIDAAEAGKQVAAVIELKARFDEENNINWARTLEEAGVHVVYGVPGLKVHSKILLVARREEDGIRRYCHIGTGNYNPKTARSYEDMGLFSSDPVLTRDVGDLFNYLTGFSKHVDYEKLVVSPVKTRKAILGLINDQAQRGVDGRIVIKVNGLTDVETVDALYRASRAGTRVDLIVRGVCSLRPRLSGLSGMITVKSIVGRFLEHSRIYAFGQEGSDDRRLLIGSADLMERNLDRRIEALVPVSDTAARNRVEDVLDLCLKDDTNSWELMPSGSWERVPAVTGISAQAALEELALDRVRRRRDPELQG
ncbi:MAG: polyphosphate kinase 1 [Acidimicrobiales bacterium]